MKALLAALLLGFATPAHAGLSLAGDVGQTFGGGVQNYDLGARIGWTIDFAKMHLTPEAALRVTVGSDTALAGGFFGGRLTYGNVVAPGIYVLTGSWMYGGGASTVMGGVLDLRIIPLIVLGVHGGYELQGYSVVGVHAGIEF